MKCWSLRHSNLSRQQYLCHYNNLYLLRRREKFEASFSHGLAAIIIDATPKVAWMHAPTSAARASATAVILQEQIFYIDACQSYFKFDN